LLKTVLKIKKSFPGIKDPAAELILWHYCSSFLCLLGEMRVWLDFFCYWHILLC